MSGKRSSFFIIFLLVTYLGIAQTGLVGHWSFDHSTTDIIKDETSFEHNGITNGAAKIAGVKGKALYFNGDGAFAKIRGNGQNTPEVISELGEGSISLWFKAEYIPTEYGIAPIFYYGSTEKCDFFDAANEGLIIEIGHSPIYEGNESLFFTIWKNGCTYPSFCYDSNQAIEIGKWYHFVAVVGENYNTGYLNGKEMTNRFYNFGDETYSQFFEDALAHEEMWLGKGHWDGTTQYFEGAIDELKIFNKALNDGEVKQLFNEVLVTSSAKPNEQEKNFRIYPNPAHEKLIVELGKMSSEIELMQIYNMSGNLIYEKLYPSSMENIDLQNFSTGTYSLRLNSENETFQQQFQVIKQ